MAHRVLVIGWDGAEPRIVEKLLAEGKLPNLAALTAAGAYTRIHSTVRPESSVAWTTFATGVEAGEHGVFGFTRQIPGSYQTELVSTRCVRQPFFWETLGQHGKRVAILNMPMAYPPRPVNGWLVCGLMTPDERSQFTYPATLGPELLSQGYVIDADPITVDERESRRDYLQRMTDQVRERTRLALSLLGNLDWDLGMVIFTELDRLQHFYWADHDPHHPRRPADPFVDAITDHYVELDQALGRLAALAGSEASVIVMSDHGFGPCARQFLVNNWLIHAGWLALKGDLQHMAIPGRSLARFARRIPLARQLKRRFFGKRSLIKRAERRMFLNMVDWSRTRAWYTDVGGVRFNVRGREPEGLVSPGAEYRQLTEKIVAELVDLEDPQTGRRVVESAFHRDDIYAGSEVEGAPDIILVPKRLMDDAQASYWISSYDLDNLAEFVLDSVIYSGDHAMEGMCASNTVPLIQLHALSDISRWIMAQFNISWGEAGSIRELGQSSFSPDESDLIHERLRKLGYLD